MIEAEIVHCIICSAELPIDVAEAQQILRAMDYGRIDYVFVVCPLCTMAMDTIDTEISSCD